MLETRRRKRLAKRHLCSVPKAAQLQQAGKCARFLMQAGLRFPLSAFRCPAGSTAGLSLQQSHLRGRQPLLAAPPPTVYVLFQPSPIQVPHMADPLTPPPNKDGESVSGSNLHVQCPTRAPLLANSTISIRRGSTAHTANIRRWVGHAGPEKSRSHIIIIRYPGSFQLALRTREREGEQGPGRMSSFLLEKEPPPSSLDT